MWTQGALGRLGALLARQEGNADSGAMQDEDWTAVLQLANAHLLGPALHEAVSVSPAKAGVPPDVLDYLHLLRTLNTDRNDGLRRQCLEIVHSLSCRGIDCLLLKGATALFERGSVARETRMMRDLDILVRPDAAMEALGILSELGYDTLNRSPEGDHAVAELGRPGDGGTVDLHTELIDASYLIPARDVFARGVWVEDEGYRVQVPSVEDRLLHHLLHAQVHHKAQFYRGQVRLNQLYNFHEMATAPGSVIDWVWIVRALDAFRLAPALHSYLLLAHVLFAMPWPLMERPSREGLRHSRRALMQLRHPLLDRAMIPFGNLWRAFAWHRMCAIYGHSGPASVKRLRHILQYVQKKTPGQAFIQLFRFE